MNTVMMAEVPNSGQVGNAVLLDEERLALLREIGGEELVADLLGRYLLDLKAKREELGAALARRDWKGLAAEAHALKGASANLGALSVAEACAALEIGARRGTEESLGNALEDLEVAAAAVIAYLIADSDGPDSGDAGSADR